VSATTTFEAEEKNTLIDSVNANIEIIFSPGGLIVKLLCLNLWNLETFAPFVVSHSANAVGLFTSK